MTMWSPHEANVARRLAIAHSVEVAARVVGRKQSEIEELLKDHKPKPFTESERKFLRHYIQKYDINRVASLMDRMPEEILVEANKLGFMLIKTNVHVYGTPSEEEKARLTRMIKRGAPPEIISEITGRSEDFIRRFRQRHCLSEWKKSRKWTDDDDRMIKEWYGKISSKELALKMDRTLHALRKRAGQLGVSFKRSSA